MSVRERWFAWLYHTLLSGRVTADLADALTREVRAPLLARARGAVLEIGAGDGVNRALYPADTQVTLLEPNRYLVAYLPGVRSDAVRGRGEYLPFQVSSFDTVVSIYVLCSVRDQAAALAEIRRVLRPGGQFLFLEHVAAPPHSLTLVAQRAINPAWSAIGAGCHLTRRTGATIGAAGFRSLELHERDAPRPYPAIVRPHIYGFARA